MVILVIVSVFFTACDIPDIAKFTEQSSESTLTSALETQIEKANSDAGRLQQIKDALERATKTVNEVKALINQLTGTDASIKDRLAALVESLGSISSIFVPQN